MNRSEQIEGLLPENPSPLAPVRVNCHQHRICLYAGDELPDGGAAKVAELAGCPTWQPLSDRAAEHDPALYADCPVAALHASESRD